MGIEIYCVLCYNNYTFKGENMGLKEYIQRKKREKLPLIARVDLTELQKQREKEMEDREVSILAAADYTKRIPTIRLYYTALEKFRKYGSGDMMVGQTHGVSSPFRLPDEMSIEDACKVVSYLSNMVETDNEIEPASEKSVIAVSNILENYGFRKVEGKEKGHYHSISAYEPFRKIKSTFAAGAEIEGVVDLFTVGGDFRVFNRSDMHDRYFDWYTSSVTKQDVENIYKNIRREYLLPDDFEQDSM